MCTGALAANGSGYLWLTQFDGGASDMCGKAAVSARKKDGSEVAVDIAMSAVVMDTSEVAVVLSVIDNSARKRAERAEFFVQELTHRARNMFAIIRAISRQIAKYRTFVSEFQIAFERRLNARSASYQVFEKENRQAAPIGDLVRSQISFVKKQHMC